jgi:ubiquinone/menaquinone biosynthesis C-methylase UbiE
MAEYGRISIGGGDTAKPRIVQKRIELITRYVKVRGSKMLDCGCGAGGYVLALLELGADASGIEYSKFKVDQFHALKIEPERVRAGDIEQLDFPDNVFDWVLLNEVLEHVPNDSRALAEAFRVLKPNGVVVIFSPNRLYPFETHGIDLKHPKMSLPHYTPFIPYIPLAVGRRVFDIRARNYFPSELAALTSSAGFRIIAREYVSQTFENISGRQPRIITLLLPILRSIADTIEQLPGLRSFCVSQAIVAQK